MSTIDTQPKRGTFRAICECGQVRRTTSRAGYGKTGEWTPPSRCMVPLKCSHCGTQTMHAYIRDFVPARYADDDERRQASETEGARLALAGTLGTEAVLEAIGVRPMFVVDLESDAIVLLEDHLVLIKAGLSPERMTKVMSELLKGAESDED